MATRESIVHHHYFGRQMAPFALSQTECASPTLLRDLRELTGLAMDMADVESMMADLLKGAAMDDAQGLVTTISLTNPIQFLQAWLPGFVQVLTAARKADEILGMTAIGDWEDEEVIQGIKEGLGSAGLYGDHTNIPFADWNVNFERRTVIRWEMGLRVGNLEDARSARMRVNNAQEKRAAALLALEIVRNRVAFSGFNGGNNRTYGFLNDPNLPAYVTVAATGTGSTTTWSTKTFLNITADLRAAFAALRTNSQDNIDPRRDATTLVLATAVDTYLTVTSDFGVSVEDWLKKQYPNCRIVTAPELNAANGGANVFYLFADKVNDGGSDGGATFKQLVPAKFRSLGTARDVKAYIEDNGNALAGVMVCRPFAVVRRSGI